MTAILEARSAKETMEGDGVTVRRLMPIQGFMNFDPFALWDHFTIKPANGFPDHPHRGFEAITYIFSGSMNHTDNLGNSSTVTAGGAQRFTAGSGLVHSEMPAKEGETIGIQLWINLPQRLKSLAPSYQQVDAEDIPEENFEFGKVRYIVGHGSALKLNSSIEYRVIKFDSVGEYQTDIPNKYHGFIYTVSGTITVFENQLTKGDALFLSEVSNITINASHDAQLMLCFGLPHDEKMHQHGPYVD